MVGRTLHVGPDLHSNKPTLHSVLLLPCSNRVAIRSDCANRRAVARLSDTPGNLIRGFHVKPATNRTCATGQHAGASGWKKLSRPAVGRNRPHVLPNDGSIDC